MLNARQNWRKVSGATGVGLRGARTVPKGPRAFEAQRKPLSDIKEINTSVLFEVNKRMGPERC